MAAASMRRTLRASSSSASVLSRLRHQPARRGAGRSDRVNPHELVEQRLEQVEPQRVLRVALRLRRVLVDFHEHAVDAGGDAGRGQRLDELRLAGRDAVAGARSCRLCVTS